MSGIAHKVTCPKCGNTEARGFTNNEPHTYTDVECLQCGYYVTTIKGFMNLEELNGGRFDNNLPPLDKLPIQNH